MELKRFYGDDIVARWPAIAALRLQVFREYPYLYDGTMLEEEDYGRVYGRSPDAMAVLAFNENDEVVGASTCMPLVLAHDSFQKPFRDLALRPEDYFYLAESMLLKPYRGQKLGHRFFHERESQARQCGFRHACFCAIERDLTPPPTYQPLNQFWLDRGYVRHPDIRSTTTWRDVGFDEPTPKQLIFWTRTL